MPFWVGLGQVIRASYRSKILRVAAPIDGRMKGTGRLWLWWHHRAILATKLLWWGDYTVVLQERMTVAGLPETYFVPRDGAFLRVTAFDPNQLRRLRTELELLRRIRRRVRTCDTRPAADLVNRYTDADRAELSRIVRDASHPAVQEMIDLFDREFPEIRKDIMMSVVNDESENIVQEAAEAGVINADSAVDLNPGSTPPAINDDTVASSPSENPVAGELAGTDLSEALSEAEAALDETVKLCQEGVCETVDVEAADEVEATSSNVIAENELPPAAESVVEAAIGVDVTDAEAASSADDTEGKADAKAPDMVSEDAVPVDLDNAGDASIEATEALEQAVEAVDQPEMPKAADAPEPSPQPQALSLADPEVAAEEAMTIDMPVTANAVPKTAPGVTKSAEAATPEVEVPVDVTAPVPEAKAGDASEAEPENAADSVPCPPETKPDKPSAGADDAYTYDRATEAVETIERGIRKIAATLQDEVTTQWKDAKEVLTQMTESGQRASEGRSEIESLLAEIKQLRDDAKSAVEELGQAREQARVSREDARRAKERAEASASAAELAADQASRDAQHAAQPSGAA